MTFQSLIPFENIVFNEREHKYFLNKKELSGITSGISGFMGKKYPDKFVAKNFKAREAGTIIHRATNILLSGFTPDEVIPDETEWILEYLDKHYPSDKFSIGTEILVTNFETIASAIDILIYNRETNEFKVLDIKTGQFLVTDVGWQLNIYKYLLESQGFKVNGLGVLSTKLHLELPVIEKESSVVKDFIDGVYV